MRPTVSMHTGMWFTVLLALTGLSNTHAHKWGYDEDSGPHHWPRHFPNNCSGTSQSPININAEETLFSPNLKDFAIWYDPPRANFKLYLKNNGHTAQVDLEGDFFVSNGGLPNIYKAFQFHFHWGHHKTHGSEHTLEGKAYPLELHLVTYNHELYSGAPEALHVKGGLAVLGVFYEVTEEDNPAIETVIRGLKHIKHPQTTRVELPTFSIRDLLPSDLTRYFRYNGSLTTPSCLESVIWTVFFNTQTISERQLGEFRKLLQIKLKKGSKRHRRSLSKAQKLERDAEYFLDELSLFETDYERTLTKAKLLQELMSDMPQPDSGSGKSQYKPRLDEEKASKIDKHAKSDGGNSAEEKHHKATSSEHATDEETEHEILVNNYRPPQPLHERIVHRSFKLSVPLKTEKPEPVDSRHMAMKEDGGNSSGHAAASISVLLITFIFRIIF